MSGLSRRDFLAAMGAGAAGALLPGTPSAGPVDASRPNVLFIAVDDLKPLLNCYGADHIRSPHMDRLAGRGTIFQKCYCQQAVCGPSRASLLTGLRPDTTGVWDLKTKMRDVNPDVLTLPQHFKRNGYTTVGRGKLFDGRCCDGWVSQDRVSWSVPGKGVGGRRYAKKHEGKPPTERLDVADDVYTDGRLAEAGVSWLRKLAGRDEPFFLGVGFHKPHLPFTAPAKYWDIYDRETIRAHVADFQKRPGDAPPFAYQDSWELRGGYTGVPKDGPIPMDLQRDLVHGYYACVSFVDAQIGKVLTELDRLGLTENTVVCLWGDHGWHLGDHGMWCKHTNYEQATRSPLIISVPGQPNPGAEVESPTEFVDIFPTLCELAGLPVPEQLQGVSLAPLMKLPSGRVKRAAISQFPRGTGGGPAMGYAYRSDRYRYVEWVRKNFRKGETEGPVIARELYDYREDPLETVNLAEDPRYAEAASRMQKIAEGGWQGLVTGP